MGQTEVRTGPVGSGRAVVANQPTLDNRIAGGQTSSVSDHLDAPYPIVVTDSRNRVTQMNGHFESAIETSRAESVGQNVLELIGPVTAPRSSRVDGAIHPSSRALPSRPLLSLVAIAPGDQIVWRISKHRRSNDGDAVTQLRIDPAGHVAAKPDSKTDSGETISHSREEVLASLEEERLRSLVPRLTSLVGHLDLAMLCVGSVTNSPRQPESQLARSVITARKESDRIASVVRELRLIRQSTASVPRQQSLESLFERSTCLLSNELDRQEIDLQCADRMKDPSVLVVVDGIAVCQSMLWLVRTAAISLDQNDRCMHMDSVVENGTLTLGVSFTRHENQTNQVTAVSGSFALTRSQPEQDDSKSRLASPPVHAKWTRKNFPNGRSTIAVAVPCIRGDR